VVDTSTGGTGGSKKDAKYKRTAKFGKRSNLVIVRLGKISYN